MAKSNTKSAALQSRAVKRSLRIATTNDKPAAAPARGSVAARAMLVSLWQSSWGNRKSEDSANAHIATEFKSELAMGNYTKKLVAKKALAAIGSARSQARGHHYEQTLPWLDNGYRILPAANYLSYMAEQRRLRDEFDKAVDAFLVEYPDHVEQSRRSLGSMFNPRDYPTVAELRGRFSMHVSVTPIPTAQDFRVDLPGGEIAKIQSDIEERLQRAFADATQSLHERIIAAVTHVRDRLAKFEVATDGSTLHPFRDSVIVNLRELCELLPRLNVNNDGNLDAMRAHLVETLCAVEPSTLRADDKARHDTIDAANDILKAMSGYAAG